MQRLSIHVVLTANGVMQMSKGQASISMWWCVHSSFHDNAKLPWKVNGPAFNSHIFLGAVTAYSLSVGTPTVVDINT